jgi:hypothetical protein
MSRTRLALSLAIASGFFSLAGWSILTARAQCCGQSAALPNFTAPTYTTSYLPQVASSMSYSAGYASDCCQAAPAACGPSYRLESRTVYDKQEVNAYRVSYDTEYEESSVTVYKPVWETENRERSVTVRKPIVETSMREERTVNYKPVWETTYRDESYDVVKQIPETSEREEQYTVQRPVVETSMREERYMVARPVTETCEREERFVVRRPVVETSEREQCSTTYDAVTTYQTRYADQGYMSQQQVCMPGAPTTRLGWQQGGYTVNPQTGLPYYQRGGLGWVTQAGPSQLATVNTWNQNIVPYQVPQTSYQPRTVVTKVPVQITRMVDQEVVQKVPYQVTKMVQEEQVRQIPVQTTRMEQQVMTRKVPVTTFKTVTERVEKQVPIQVCKYVAEEQVKQIPIQTTRYVDEVKTEPYSVQVCKMVAEQQTVRKPRTVEKRTPIVRTYLIPRTETYKIPLDAFGNPLEVTTPTSRVIEDRRVEDRPRTNTSGKPTLAEDAEKNGTEKNGASVMKNGEANKTDAKKPMTAEDKAPGPEAF